MNVFVLGLVVARLNGKKGCKEMSDESNVEKSIDTVCVWHKSTSIETNNPMYDSCRQKCDGYNFKCLAYLPKKNYIEFLKQKANSQREEKQ